MELIVGSLSKPSNGSIGKVQGVTEAAIRYRQNNSPEEFEDNIRKYRMAKSPFIPISDYNIEMKTKYSSQDVLDGTLPGILNKDGSVLLPTCLDMFLSAFKELKKLGGCSVISPANFKGGVGKTSTVINLATTLSFIGAKVLIVDFDIQGNTTSMFNLYRDKLQSVKDKEIQTKKIDMDLATSNKIDELYDFDNSDFKYTIVDLLASIQKENIKDLVEEAIINLNDKVNTIGKLDIIPNASNIENALKFEDIEKYIRNYGNTNKVLDDILSLIKDEYDFIIIDTPPSISLPLRMSTMATDYFIILLTPDKMAKDGIAPFLVPIEMNRAAYLREKKKEITILGGILNKYQGTKIQQINKTAIDNDLNITTENADLGTAKLFENYIKLDNVLNEAQYQTGSVLVFNPTHELVRDYFELTLEIMDSIVIDKMSK